MGGHSPSWAWEGKGSPGHRSAGARVTKRRREAACSAGVRPGKGSAHSPGLSPHPSPQPPALESEAMTRELDKAAKRSSCAVGSRVKEGNQGRPGPGGPQKLPEGVRKNTKGTSGPRWSPVCNTLSLLAQITWHTSRVKIPPAEITQALPGMRTQGTEQKMW